MKHAVWNDDISDDDIIAMMFEGEMTGFKCPHCSIEQTCEVNDYEVECECSETFIPPHMHGDGWIEEDDETEDPE